MWRIRRGVVFAAFAMWFVAGCDGEGGGGGDDVLDPDAGPGIGDAAREDGGPVTPRDGGEPDEGPGDARVDRDGDARDAAPPDLGLLPDMFPGTPIETCEDACGRYESCNRLGEIFGDGEACMRRCERVSRTGRPAVWFDCLEVESCRQLQLCRPPRVEPLPCAETCARVVECGAGGITADACAAACESSGEPFRACGETLVEACDNDGFVQCLGTSVFAICQSACGVVGQCGVQDAAECLVQCVDRNLGDDPLAQLRARQLAQCTAAAAQDCQRVSECVTPPQPGQGPPRVDQAQFCAAYDGCQFEFEFGVPCEEIYQEFVDFSGPGGLQCAVQAMQARCDLDLFLNCFDNGGGGVDPVARDCGRLCEAQDVCGIIEGERVECVTACIGDEQQDRDLAERAQIQLGCANSDRCDALDECLDGASSAAQCEAHCARLEGCGLAGDDCAAACDAVWPRDRHARFRDCVAAAAEAGNCEVMAGCEVPPSMPCAQVCARIEECGLQAVPGCAGACDDAHFADPVPTEQVTACVLTAPACLDGEHSVQRCLRTPDRGRECLGWCRAASAECGAEAPQDLGACLSACGAGLVGDEGLRFEVARECLAVAPADADCAALARCIPPDAVHDCGPIVDRAAACDVELPEAALTCADDPLTRLRGLRARQCLDGAGDDCDDARACLLPGEAPDLPPPPPPGVDEEAFCAVWNGCGLDDFFGFCEDMYADAESAGEGVAQCIYDGLAPGCPDDLFLVFDLMDACYGGAGPVEPPAPHPFAGECDRLCTARDFCDDLGEQGRPDCRIACEATVDPTDPIAVGRAAPRMACAEAWSCAELGLCLATSSPEALCAAHCARLGECGEAPDAEACLADCDARFTLRREGAWRACVAAADDCEAVADCAPPPAVPCDRACERLVDCGLAGDEAACTRECDDAHFEAPERGALSVGCVLSAPACEAAPGGFGVADCLEDPEAGGRACANYCRATTACAGDADGLQACLGRCVAGFGDAEGLRFGAAARCLEGIEIDAECAPLAACVPAEVAVDCAAHCARLEGCHLDVEGCVAACEAAPDADAAGCVADALRVGAGCGGVAACVGFQPPPADPVCRRYCDERRACDRAIDPYLCRLDCTPVPAAVPVQLACLAAGGCGELETCLDLGGEPNPACAAPCDAAVACGAFPDAARCNAECTGRDATARSPDDYVDRVAACLEDVGGACDPEQALACFDPVLCELAGDVINVPPQGGRFQVDTRRLVDNYQSLCGGEGPEQVLVLTLRQRATIVFEVLEADYDPLIFVRQDVCDDDNAEVDCNDDFDGLNSLVQINQAEPGTYFLFVDGWGGGSGTSTVQVTIQP